MTHLSSVSQKVPVLLGFEATPDLILAQAFVRGRPQTGMARGCVLAAAQQRQPEGGPAPQHAKPRRLILQ